MEKTWPWLAGRIRLMNTEIDNVTMTEAVDCVKYLAEHGKGAFVVTPNVDHMIKLEKDERFAAIYADADLILADGTPLLWFAKGLGTPLKEKVSGSDLFPLVCEMAAREGLSVFFLGAAEGVAAKAAEVLKKRYSGLQVAGTYSPPFGFERDAEETKRICAMINDARPDILFVGVGAPKQEKFF
jgi:N-acetylglucosaminyldiphosphoundecaprenol N-acetyl-beta-D-mannosaminyltransferase